MRDRLSGLSEGDAVRALATFAEVQLRLGAQTIEDTAPIRSALVQAFDVRVEGGESTTAGDLAREALGVLADDPRHGDAIRALVDGPAPRFLGVVETAAVVTAVLIVLQTRLAFERDKEGRVSLKIEKKATADPLLKPLVQKLLSFLGSAS